MTSGTHDMAISLVDAEIEAKRNEMIEIASASIIRSGWTPLDCVIEVDTVTKRQAIRVRGVEVFAVTETWFDTKVTLAWEWLSEIPVREGFSPASA